MDIKRKIENTVEFSSWKDNDPNGYGQIDDFNNQLIITQTSDVHNKIANLLAQLREAQAVQVSIETRFLTVSTAFPRRRGRQPQLDVQQQQPNGRGKQCSPSPKSLGPHHGRQHIRGLHVHCQHVHRFARIPLHLGAQRAECVGSLWKHLRRFQVQYALDRGGSLRTAQRCSRSARYLAERPGRDDVSAHLPAVRRELEHHGFHGRRHRRPGHRLRHRRRPRQHRAGAGNGRSQIRDPRHRSAARLVPGIHHLPIRNRLDGGGPKQQRRLHGHRGLRRIHASEPHRPGSHGAKNRGPDRA